MCRCPSSGAACRSTDRPRRPRRTRRPRNRLGAKTLRRHAGEASPRMDRGGGPVAVVARDGITDDAALEFGDYFESCRSAISSRNSSSRRSVLRTKPAGRLAVGGLRIHACSSICEYVGNRASA